MTNARAARWNKFDALIAIYKLLKAFLFFFTFSFSVCILCCFNLKAEYNKKEQLMRTKKIWQINVLSTTMFDILLDTRKRCPFEWTTIKMCSFRTHIVVVKALAIVAMHRTTGENSHFQFYYTWMRRYWINCETPVFF